MDELLAITAVLSSQGGDARPALNSDEAERFLAGKLASAVPFRIGPLAGRGQLFLVRHSDGREAILRLWAGPLGRGITVLTTPAGPETIH